MVAAVQLSIALGSTVGELPFDASGYLTSFIASTVVPLAAAGLALSASSPARRTRPDMRGPCSFATLASRLIQRATSTSGMLPDAIPAAVVARVGKAKKAAVIGDGAPDGYRAMTTANRSR